MTAPARGTPRLAAIPASQNTAPVAEFRCLFTHDTRKKQKKWQDGFLKFHSFNSRVIVYDASRFAVGDTYYKDSPELHEGDELMLDKGVMVEVAEPMGVTQTDLTPLFDRKASNLPQQTTAPVPQRPLPRPTIPASNPLRAASQLRHKSLNTLLGTPKGPMGKAIPIISPYQERMDKENARGEERGAKRQKIAHAAPVQQPTRPSVASENAPKKIAPVRTRPMHRDPDIQPRPRTLPHDATVINLSSQPEADTIPSDVTLPCTPSKHATIPIPPSRVSIPARKEALPLQKVVPNTPKLPKGKVPVPHIKAQQTPRQPPPASSPPVSASNRITNVDFAIQPIADAPKERSPVPSPAEPPQPLQPLQNRKTKSLKLSRGPKRGMLLCQSAPVRRQMTPDEPKARTVKPVERVRLDPLEDDQCTSALQKVKNAPQVQSPRTDNIRAGTRPPAPQPEDVEAEVVDVEDVPLEILDDAPLSIMNDPDLVHGFMDQQLLVTPSPPPGLQTPDLTKLSTAAKPSTTKQKKAPKTTKRVNEAATEESAPNKKRTKATQTKDPAVKPTKNKKTEKPVPVHSRSPSPVPKPNVVASRDFSVTPSEPATDRPRKLSASSSPTKLSALSAGGFKRKTKKVQSRTASPDLIIPPPQPTTVALPPHPLRSSKNGPLMTTTELSALLQKGPKSMRLEDDPIEDASQEQNNSASKRSSKFKRSRSENDAPIPSTSEEWEQRNVPKDPDPSDPAKPAVTAKPKKGGLAALVKKTDPRRKFVRAQSLSVATGLANAHAEAPEVVTPPVDHDVGPWSTEAFDLFDWRPPGKEWKAEGSRMMLVDVGEQHQHPGLGMLIDGK